MFRVLGYSLIVFVAAVPRGTTVVSLFHAPRQPA